VEEAAILETTQRLPLRLVVEECSTSLRFPQWWGAI
jgi:hypothetical protein